MGFNLSRPAKKIHCELLFSVDEETWNIMGVFKTLPTNAAIDEFIRTLRTLEAKFVASSEFAMWGTIENLASSVFIGWVNPEGREDLWVVSNGIPVDCTDKTRQEFLSIPGIALAICQHYASTIGGKQAALGNSEPSPVSTSPPIDEPLSQTS